MFITEESILVDVDDVKSVEEKERDKFIKSFLLSMDLPIEDIWPEESLKSVEDKRKLLKLLESLHIHIINDGGRGTKIYYENDLLAEWFKPRVILKREIEATKKPRDQYYYELILKTAIKDG